MTLKSEYFLQMQDTIGDMQTFLIKVLEKGGGGHAYLFKKGFGVFWEGTTH